MPTPFEFYGDVIPWDWTYTTERIMGDSSIDRWAYATEKKDTILSGHAVRHQHLSEIDAWCLGHLCRICVQKIECTPFEFNESDIFTFQTKAKKMKSLPPNNYQGHSGETPYNANGAP